MSAFVVPLTHINAIVQFASNHRVSLYRAAGQSTTVVTGHEQATAELLLQENVRSVNCRYASDDPAPIIRYDGRAPTLSPLAVLKACNCLDYQSCETTDWDMTDACQLLDAIRREAVRCLPGYDAAEWCINDVTGDPS